MRELIDSKIEWIGDMPNDWKTIKIKYTSWLKGRIGWQGLTASEYTDEGPFLITGTDFENGIIDWSKCAHISKERFDEDPDIHVKEGDLLITKDGTVGKVAIAKNCPDEVSLNSGVLLIRNVGNYRYYDKYLYYVLLSDEFWRWYTLSQTGQSTIKHLYQAQFYSFEFAYPSYGEQKVIANFLDSECAHIDAVIEQTRASIEEYKKLKQSVITRAVTKGIRPDRAMKDSGIEWIGEIASDYELVKLKHVLMQQLQYGANQVGIPYDITLPRYIRITDITTDGKLKESGALSLSEEDATGYILKNNDVLFARSGGTVGKAFIYKEGYGRSAFAGYLIKASIGERLLPDLLFYYTQSSIYEEWKSQIFIQATIQNIGADRYKEMPVILQPVDEQRDIVDYLSVKCGEIDSLIERKEILLLELEEYKKSMIYEYVTGKKEASL